MYCERTGIGGDPLLDLLWKIRHVKGTWSGTLRDDPSVVVTADDGDKLNRLLRGLTIGVLSAPAEGVQPSRARGRQPRTP
jgi:hypothetical protein